jgi:acyl-CoA reductase-like NAD-dependent aldehyde dehydrogenase
VVRRHPVFRVKAAQLLVGDPATGQVALGPTIDERQRDKIHLDAFTETRWVTIRGDIAPYPF